MPSIKLMSFAYRDGVPDDYAIFDARALPNPHTVPKLRPLTGLDKDVQMWLARKIQTEDMVHHVVEQCGWHWNVAVGCYAGRHRSVAIIEFVAGELSKMDVDVQVTHRELGLVRVT